MIPAGNATNNFFAIYSQVASTIGWTVIHFLWQGILIAAVMFLLLRLARKFSANILYTIACGGLCLMGLAPIVTFCTIFEIDSTVRAVETEPVSSSRVSSIDSSPSVVATTPSIEIDEPFEKYRSAPESASANSGNSLQEMWTLVQSKLAMLAPWIAMLWGIGVVTTALRLAIGWESLRKLRAQVTKTEIPQITSCLLSVKQGLGLMREITVGVSGKVTNPLVVGWLRPLVVLPTKILTELSPAQIKAVLAHELAHVKRGDFVINAIQCVIETLLFFHPCVWWASARVRQERENCCDDLAVSIVGSSKCYAQALLQLEQSRAQQQLALGANGGSLVDRIRRLTRPATTVSQRSSFAPTVFALCVLLPLMPGLIAIASASIQQQEEEKDPMILNQNIAVTVLDSEGLPLSEVDIHAGVWSGDGTVEDVVFPPNSFYKTDENGKADVVLPFNYYIVRLWVRRDGFVPMYTGWEEKQILDGDSPPETLSIEMVKGIRGGGTVVDADGKPVVGAKVTLSGGGIEPKGRVRFMGSYGAVETDESGKWFFDNLSDRQSATFTASVEHEDFLPIKSALSRSDLVTNSATISLANGVEVTGKITDQDGKIVKDGLVIWGDNPYYESGSQEVEISDEGTFETLPLKPSKKRITVVAKGYAPVSRMVEIEIGMEPVNFQLEPGKKLRIQITDEDGIPLPKSYVMLRSWRNARSLYSNIHPNVKPTGIPTRANDEGIFEWDWAPADEVVWGFGERGYLPKNKVSLVAGDEVHVIKLKKVPAITGTVRYADTGKPGRFVKVTPIIKWDENAAGRRNDNDALVANAKGQFTFEVTRDNATYLLEFSKKGYRSVLSEPFDVNSLPESLEVKLEKSSPAVGVVVDSEGNPVDSASVYVVDEFNSLDLQGFRAMSRVPTDKTDSEGSFEFSQQVDSTTLVAIHKSGYGELVLPKNDKVVLEGDSGLKVTVKPWGSIKGRVTVAGKPVTNAQVNFYPLTQRPLVFNEIHSNSYAKTDSNGNFQFSKVNSHPACITVFKRTGEDERSTRRINFPVQVVPGESLTVDLDFGHHVEVPIASSEFIKNAKFDGVFCNFMKIDGWQKVLPDGFFQANPQIDSYAKAQKFLQEKGDFKTAFLLSDSITSINGSMTKDGVIHGHVMEPGTYQITLNVPGRPRIATADAATSMLLQHTVEVTIDGGTKRLSGIEVPYQEAAEVGDSVGGFEVELIEKKVAFADYKGKILLLDFWSDWSKQINATNRDFESLVSSVQADDPLTILSLHCAPNPKAKVKRQFPEQLQHYVESLSLTYEECSEICPKFGAWNIPLAIVVDQEGKVRCIDSHKKAVEVVRDLLNTRQ